jgi:O-antigen/teichoic acid export membrane protein
MTAFGWPAGWSHRFGVRFGTTFLANIARSGFSFLTGVVVARKLGAGAYGDFNFLLASFAAINLVLDMGSSPAFYTLVAGQRRSRMFFALYILWTFGVQLLGTVLVVGVIMPQSVIAFIWPGTPRSLVLLAFGSSFMATQAWTMVSQMGEAQRRTVLVQAGAVAQSVVHFLLVVIATRAGVLAVRSLLILLIVEYALLALFLGPRLFRGSIDERASTSAASVVQLFVDYCRPLVLYGFVSFLYDFADRWLLQRYGGSVQQGLFSVGQQIGGISLLATSSILRVLWKEVADAQGAGEIERAFGLYTGAKQALYLVAAWISCFFVPWSRDILLLALGPSYEAGWAALALMLVYPVHQVLGQIQGTFFLASGNTKLYGQIGVVAMLTGIPVTYVCLAPKSGVLPGMGFGAFGLALKLVLLQVVAVNVQAVFLARRYGLRNGIGYQAAVLFGLLIVGVLARAVALHVVAYFDATSPTIVSIAAGAAIYLAGTFPLLRRTAQSILRSRHDSWQPVTSAIAAATVIDHRPR